MLAGKAVMFSQASLADSAPSITCICCSTMVMPMPANMAWTTTGAMASATRPTLARPSRAWSTPAAAVMAQVDGPAELFDQAGNDDGQAGGGSADLQR